MGLIGLKPILMVLVLALLGSACSQQAAEAPAAPNEALPSAVADAGQPAEAPPNPDLYTPTGPPPRVDTGIASVSLDEIYFDTFRGGYIPLSAASAEVIEELRDVIDPIYQPRYAPVEGGEWLDDDDLVVGYATEEGAYAYPAKMLNLHEIVNDHIDGVPVLVSYCPLCASAVVYSRELDGRVLVFGNTSALYESDMVMYDHQTGSYWFQVLGEAIVGPLTGKRLTMLTSTTVPWGEWTRRHPRTLVLDLDQGLLTARDGNPYARDSFAGYGVRLDRGQFAFPVDRQKLDNRLRHGEMVVAIQVRDRHKAYALSEESDWVVNDVVGEEGVVVVGRSGGPTASAYLSDVNGRPLEFRLVDGSLVDAETGSTWDDGGVARSGPLVGARLSSVPSRTSFWFSVAGALPGIDLHRPE